MIRARCQENLVFFILALRKTRGGAKHIDNNSQLDRIKKNVKIGQKVNAHARELSQNPIYWNFFKLFFYN